MNLFELFVKIGVDDQASGPISKIAKGLGNGIKTAAKIGTAAVGVAATGIAALTKSAVEGFAEYEQLAGGAQKIFDQMDYSRIEQDAQNAYKTMNISASDYLATMNDVGATFAATMGDEAGYNAAKTGLQAIADYASGTGKSVDVLSEKFTMITRSTSSYQSIADQFSGILPATSKDFLAQAQAAGILSDSYTELTQVPIAEYQQAVSEMLEKGVSDLGLAGNTAAETANTISGSLNAAKAAWSNLIVGIADENANFEELVNNFVETLVGDESGEGGVINNILPRVEVALEGAGKLVEALIPVIIDKVPTIINEWLPKILQSGVNIIQSIMNGMIQNQGDIVNGVVNTVNTLVNGLLDHLPEILVMGVTLIGQIAAGLIQGLPDLIGRIPEIITDIVNAFSENSDVFIEIGKSIVSGIWNGIVALWNGLVDSLSGLVNGLFGGSTTTANVNVNGSHAGGLEYVPFDGYIAELHKGERVLTADEAKGYNNRSNNSGYDERPIKIVVQSVLDGKVIGETAYNYNRRKARAGRNLMDVTLEINGRDFSSRLSTYRVEQEITYPDMLTTMDGTEHYGKPYRRDVIYFSLFPFDDDTANQDYAVLADSSLSVNYTNPQSDNAEKLYKDMKLYSNLSAVFGLRSVNGKRYYKGGEIALRATMIE